MDEQLTLPGFGDVAPPPRRDRSPVAKVDPADLAGRAARLDDLRRRVLLADCASEGGRQPIFGAGPLDPPVMVIGEAPSERDEQTGRFFSGPAGKLLLATMAEVGLEPDQLWFTNTVKCRPVTVVNGRPKNRPPSPSELRRWERVLAEEIEVVRPQRLLCLGAVAARAVIRHDFKLGAERGAWHESRFGIPALATYLAAYVLRREGADYDEAIETLRRDLRAVRQAAAGGQ